MSLVDQLHAAHKERMARLSPPKRDDEAIKQLKQEIARLHEEARRQRFVIESQKSYIEKLSGAAANSTPHLTEVLSCVCKYYDVSPEEMRSQSRAGTIPFYRQIYYFLCREYGYSLNQIGYQIRKDHSSVLHGTQKIRSMLEGDAQLECDIREIKTKIGAKVYQRQKALEKYMQEGAAE